MSTALKTQLKELEEKIAKMEAESKAKPKKDYEEEDDRFQPIWLRKGKNGKYAGGFVITPKGEKVWICIFPNKYWTKKSNKPIYKVTMDEPKPKKA